MNRIYACIDLKSFYASVECRERNLDPLTTNLVVADKERSSKTICLAVSPSLKSYGIPGRARLFEVIQKVKEVNIERLKKTKNKKFIAKSYNNEVLKNNNDVALDYIAAKPRMAYYMKYSTDIYNVYLKHLSPEDIYVYSIDEIFCDITDYLKYSKKTPKEFITDIIHDVYNTTGITATAGIGTNLYLAKVAMDIVAKHTDADKFGVRIAELDEMTYRKTLWSHRPLTSFWRVGQGYQKRLEEKGIYTMGDIARCSLENEELLYKLFGVNAELLIDHAWGYEPCTIKDIKTFKPTNSCLTSGQVLHCAYKYKQARIVIEEMADSLALDLVAKKLVTNQIVLNINYDKDNLIDEDLKGNYTGEVTTDYYGRKVPKDSHGTINIDHKTSSSKIIVEHTLKLFDKIVNRELLVKKIMMAVSNLSQEDKKEEKKIYQQFDLFSDYDVLDESRKKEKEQEKEENKLQNTLLDIKNKYGKNAILKGMSLDKYSTAKDRNNQIGGHSK